MELMPSESGVSQQAVLVRTMVGMHAGWCGLPAAMKHAVLDFGTPSTPHEAPHCMRVLRICGASSDACLGSKARLSA